MALILGAMFGDSLVPLSSWSWLVIWLFVFGYNAHRLVEDYRFWQAAEHEEDAFVVAPLVGFVPVRTLALFATLLSLLAGGLALSLIARYALKIAIGV